jgi:hypothetical protein
VLAGRRSASCRLRLRPCCLCAGLTSSINHAPLAVMSLCADGLFHVKRGAGAQSLFGAHVLDEVRPCGEKTGA